MFPPTLPPSLPCVLTSLTPSLSMCPLTSSPVCLPPSNCSEIMDFGFPQNLSPEIVKLYITQEGFRSPFAKVR